MITRPIEKDLGFVFESAERFAPDDTIAVALKGDAPRIFVFGVCAPTGGGGAGGPGGEDGRFLGFAFVAGLNVVGGVVWHERGIACAGQGHKSIRMASEPKLLWQQGDAEFLKEQLACRILVALRGGYLMLCGSVSLG